MAAGLGSGSSRQLVHQVLNGQPVHRTVTGPLAVHYCAGLAGVSLRDYTLNPRVLADCVIRYYEQFRPDAVWLSADTWVTAQAMGAPWPFPAEISRWPARASPGCGRRADIDRIPPPDPGSQGRWPLMLEALCVTSSTASATTCSSWPASISIRSRWPVR